MINPLFANLFGNILKNKINKWEEEGDKCAKGQITLRHIIEKVWEKKEEFFCCFVDFRKAFDSVPRDKFWHKMEELGVPKRLRAAMHRLY